MNLVLGLSWKTFLSHWQSIAFFSICSYVILTFITLCYRILSSKSVFQLYILSEWKTLPHKFPCFALILSQQCNGLIATDLKWRIVKLNCPTLDCTCTETGFCLDCNNIRVSPYVQCLARTGIYHTSSRKYCKYLKLYMKQYHSDSQAGGAGTTL